MKPFRFGVLVADAPSSRRLREDARRIEALGYSTALVPDHHAAYTPLAPLPFASAIAHATESLRVGTFVLANDLRHPVQLARDVATIDLLTDGRFELGLGAGSLASDHTPSGVPFHPLATRVERLGESVEILKRLLSGETVTFEGVHYDIRGVEGRPKTAPRPRPSLLVGGAGRPTLELAAREADIVSVVPPQARRVVDLGGLALRIDEQCGPTGTDRQIDWVRKAAGCRIGEIELQSFPLIVYVTTEPLDVAEKIGANIGLTARQVLDTNVVLLGTVDEIADQLVARRERWGFSYVVVPQMAYEAFAPVVARLVGT